MNNLETALSHEASESKPRKEKHLKPLPPIRMPTYYGCSSYYQPYITRDVLRSHHPVFDLPPYRIPVDVIPTDKTTLLSYRMAQAIAAARNSSGIHYSCCTRCCYLAVTIPYFGRREH